MIDKKKITLNGICPYFTMFPLEFPYSILNNLASPKEWVLDPFCGRGTTNYAARILGLPSIGVDSSRVAAAIAGAKLANTTPYAIIDEACRILDGSALDVPVGKFWDLAFHEDVLLKICRLREALLADCGAD